MSCYVPGLSVSLHVCVEAKGSQMLFHLVI